MLDKEQTGLITDPEKQSLWFQKKSPDQIAFWLSQASLKGDPKPLHFDMSRASLFAHVVDRIVSYQKEYVFRNFQEAIKIAVFSWSSDCHDGDLNRAYEYLRFLIALAGRFRTGALLGYLTKWIIGRRFENVEGQPSATHLSLLSNVLSYGINDPGIADICKTDINVPVYAPVCYRALWQKNHRNACKYFPLMARHNLEHGSTVVDLRFLFWEVEKRLGHKKIMKYLPGPLYKIDEFDLQLHIEKTLKERDWTIIVTAGRIIVLSPPSLSKRYTGIDEHRDIQIGKISLEMEIKYIDSLMARSTNFDYMNGIFNEMEVTA